jgi:hypothetical protein
LIVAGREPSCRVPASAFPRSSARAAAVPPFFTAASKASRSASVARRLTVKVMLAMPAPILAPFTEATAVNVSVCAWAT